MYSKDELIGKNHNIIKAEDNNPELYKNLWETILKGKPWKGILKNKKKNNEYYYVDSVVSPIKNKKGEIVEFIALRKDITDAIEAKKEIERSQKEQLIKLGEFIEMRSVHTSSHVKKVSELSYLLAKLIDLDEKEALDIKEASMMHDIGKISIPDNILNKTEKLNNDEYDIMKSHSKIGFDILKTSSNNKIIQLAAQIANEHHERWDGNGYPNGLSGNEISLPGRIVAIVDVFEALASKRPYKAPWPKQDIFIYIRDEAGKQFDPTLAEKFISKFDDFYEIHQKYE